MSKYFKNQNMIKVAEDGAVKIFDKLPAKAYQVEYNPAINQFWLVETSSPERPSKIYGDLCQKAEKIINTFLDRPNKNTGVLLSGEKGSGKTLLAKLVTEDMIRKNIPVIIISKTFPDTALATFLTSIDDRCVVIFEEFEKMYKETDSSDNENNQEGLLSLFDGVYAGNKLFILTINQIYAVNDHLLSRPGRLYYYFKFSGIGADAVKEYCTTQKVNAKDTKEIITIQQSLSRDFSFDILQTIVEESKRYKQSPLATLQTLNIEPSEKWENRYRVSRFTKNNTPLDYNGKEDFYMGLMTNESVYHYFKDDKKEYSFRFGPHNLISRTSKTLTYAQDGYELILKKETYDTDWKSMFFRQGVMD
jgi:hypothetical protein